MNYRGKRQYQTQRMMLRQYAAEHGLTVVDEYIDDGWSGTNFERPSFQRMIDDIEDRKINCVVTKDDCVIIEPTQKDLENQGFVAGSICFDPKQKEFQSYNAICAAGSVTEEMPDQKRIVLNIERLSAVRRNPGWRVTALFSAVTGRSKK